MLRVIVSAMVLASVAFAQESIRNRPAKKEVPKEVEAVSPDVAWEGYPEEAKHYLEKKRVEFVAAMPEILAEKRKQLQNEMRKSAKTKDAKENKRQSILRMKKDIESSEKVYERALSNDPPFFPPLLMNDLKIGQWGMIPPWDNDDYSGAEVFQVVDKTNVMVKFRSGKYESDPIWLQGVDTSKLIDGEPFPFINGVFHVAGNKTYGNVAGGQKTIVLLKLFIPGQVEEDEEKPSKGKAKNR